MPGAGPHPHAVAARAPSGRHVRWPRPSRSNSTSFGLETLFTHNGTKQEHAGFGRDESNGRCRARDCIGSSDKPQRNEPGVVSALLTPQIGTQCRHQCADARTR